MNLHWCKRTFPFALDFGLEQKCDLHRQLSPYLTVRGKDSWDPLLLINNWTDASRSLYSTPVRLLSQAEHGGFTESC